MRIWSIHPRYLDTVGLTAAWREGLGARTSLRRRLDARAAGVTPTGYAAHAQLARFEAEPDPIAALDAYLHGIVDEAEARGYRYDRSKLTAPVGVPQMPVTLGQLDYEARLLLDKLKRRSRVNVHAVDLLTNAVEWSLAAPHPMLCPVDGDVEAWERVRAA